MGKDRSKIYTASYKMSRQFDVKYYSNFKD